MNPSAIDPRLFDLLQRASSLDLYQLSLMIDRMLGDPKRIMQVRQALHVGQRVRYLDSRDGQLRSGLVVELKSRQLIVFDEVERVSWSMPYAAIELPAADGAVPPQPKVAEAPKPGRGDFRCGEKVAFEDRHLNTVVGTIVRINQRTASVDPGDGITWRVGFGLLRHVVDI